MHRLESLQKLLSKISAKTHGQVPQVRTFQGRQLYFLNSNQPIFQFPYIKSTPIQDISTGGLTFMVDLDKVDGGSPIK